MRFVTAMYDAPYPALAAVHALAAAGLGPRDVAVLPSPPDRPDADWLDPRDPQAPDCWLRALGVGPASAARYAEGLRRGAILVIARCPTLSAEAVARTLAVAALDLRSAADRWRDEPDLRYRWGPWPAAPDPLAAQAADRPPTP